MKRKILRVLFTLALVVGLTLVMAVPVSAASVTSADFDITVSADDAVDAGNSGASIGTVTMDAAQDDADGTTAIVLVIQSGDYQWVDAGTADDGTVDDEGWDSVAGAITTVTTTNDTLTFADTGANPTAAVTVDITGATIAATVGAGIEATTDVFLSYDGTVLPITDEDIGDVTEVAGTATQLAFTTQPAGSVSGIALTTQPIVEAQDQFGNKDTTYVTNVVAATDEAGTLTGTTTQTPVAGVATFDDLVYTATADAETFQIDVASGTLTGATSDDVICDVVATKLVFTTQPAGSVSGIALTTQPVVEARNADDLLDTDYVTNVVASEDDAGTLTGTTTQTPVAGVATFTDLVYTATADGETFQIDVASGTLTGATSADVVCDVVATKILITTAPANIVSGVSMTQPVVEYVDANDITDVDIDADVIAVTEDGVGSLAGTLTATATNGVATFTDLVYTALADNEAVTFTFTDDAAGAVDFSAAPVTSAQTADVVATKLVFTTQPGGSVSGIALTTQPVVEAQDAGNLLDTDYVTDVVASEDDAGTLTGTTTQTPVAGVATFTDLVYTATADGETFQIDVASGTLTGVTSSDVVCDVVATQLVFTTQPAGSASGVALTTQPVVEAQDADNTLDADYVTDVVAATDDAGTLSGTLTVTPVAGVATFTDLVYTATADDETFQIDVTSGTLTGATSNDVICGVVATKLVIVTQPAGAVSGSALLIQPVIHAVNDAGVLDTDYVTACAVIKETGTGTVAGTDVSPMLAGVATFTDVTVTESPVVHDSYTLRFTSGGLDYVVSDTFKVFDKVWALNDGWTLISTDDYIINSGDDTSAFEGTVSLKYKYTGSSFVPATIADLEPVEALYVKTTGDDGWVGLNYSTVASPGASIKDLVTGWNLISSATSTAAGTVLSPLRYVEVGQQQGVGLATLVSQGSYNLTTGDWYIDAITWTNLTGTMNPFDGYWVYMNAAKSFGVIPQ